MVEQTQQSTLISGMTELERQVKSRFGVLPNFFRLAPANPEITEKLWGFAQFAYLDNPLPSLFKERLFVYLSRFCEVRYCIARHVGFLLGLGRPSADAECPVQKVEEVVRLIQRPLARGEELETFCSFCSSSEKPLRDLPQAGSEMENALFALASHVFLQTDEAPRCFDLLKDLLADRLQYLSLFLAFVRTAHYWTKVHPELSFEDDIKELLATQEALAQHVLKDPEAQCDGPVQKILDELPGLRREAQQTTALLAAIVESSDDAIVGINLDGTISAWNKSAEHLFGYTAQEAIGKHITLIVPDDRVAEESDLLARLRHGERIRHFETVRRAKDGGLLDVSLSISPIRDSEGRIAGFSKVSRDLTDRNEAAKKIRRADDALRLMKVQDQERRHIARELHDTAGQTLAVLGMNFGQLMDKLGQAAPDLHKEGQSIQELIHQLQQEIRTTSYLLHPPLLDESGLASALSWYVNGLKERGALDVVLETSDSLGRLPSDLELAIFRVVQECLTNVHRHSGCNTAMIRIARNNGAVEVEVRDQGKGISPQRMTEIQSQGSGVGLRGIRERLAQFGGEVRVDSNGSGTTVLAIVPIPMLQKPAAMEARQVAV